MIIRALRSPAISDLASVAKRPPEALAESAHAHQSRHAHGHRQHHKAEFARRGPQIPPANGPGPLPTQRALSHSVLLRADFATGSATASVSSTTIPSRSTILRSARLATSGSCVTSTSVVPALLVPLQQKVQHHPPVGGVQIARRLIGHHNRRLDNKGPRQRHPLLLAAGELHRVVVHALAPGQPRPAAAAPASGRCPPRSIHRAAEHFPEP